MAKSPQPRQPLVKSGSQSRMLTLRTLPGVWGAGPRRLLGVRGALPYSTSVSVCFLFLSCCGKVRSDSDKSQEGNRPQKGRKQGLKSSAQSPDPGLPLQPPPSLAETLGCSHSCGALVPHCARSLFLAWLAPSRVDASPIAPSRTP